MTVPTLLSRKEFAEYKGWSAAYVSKLGKTGRLVLTADGKKVDVVATEALLRKSADPTKEAVAVRHARERTERDVGQYTRPMAPEIPDLPEPPDEAPAGDDFSRLQRARARREHFLALQAENEYRKQIGELVERERVESAAYKLGRLQRDVLMGLPTKVAPQLASMTDPWAIEKALRDAIRSTLEDLAKMAEQDLSEAMH